MAEDLFENIRAIFVYSCEFSNSGKTFEYSIFRIRIERSSHPYCMLQIDGVSGRRTTYAELQSEIVRVASALWRLGIRKGDVVTLFSENRPEFIVMFLSLAAVGAVVSATNSVYTSGWLLS